jgi:cell division protein FtsB
VADVADLEAHRRARSRADETRAGGRLWGRLALMALIPVVLYSLGVVAEKSLQTYQMRQRMAVLRAEVEAEKQENVRLQNELIGARTDQEVEDAARRYLNLARPGDQPVVLSGAARRPTTTPTPTRSPATDLQVPDWLARLLSNFDR